jgi:integrase
LAVCASSAARLEAGVSASVLAKSYRLMRGILNTAVDPDAILSRNPCKVPGAGRESPEERPLVTVAQVFDVAERMPDRWSAMVLLAAFGSLRFGEVIALRCGDLAKDASTVRISRAFVDVPGQGLLVGPPKSRAGVRTVIMPHAVRAELLKHLHEFVEPDDEALLFTGKKGLALRRPNFAQLSKWTEVVADLGLKGLHFHDLRHAGNVRASKAGYVGQGSGWRGWAMTTCGLR